TRRRAAGRARSSGIPPDASRSELTQLVARRHQSVAATSEVVRRRHRSDQSSSERGMNAVVPYLVVLTTMASSSSGCVRGTPFTAGFWYANGAVALPPNRHAHT